MRTLVWFRGKDLRLADHEPLRDAASQGDVIPLFVLDPYFFAPERARELPHRLQFLLESLRSLEQNLASRGTRLLIVPCKSTEVVPNLARRWKVDRVVAHRSVEPFGHERDRWVAAALEVPFELAEGETLLPPGTLRTGAGQPYAVFTAFARAFAQMCAVSASVRAPSALPPIPAGIDAETVAVPTCEALGFAPNPRVLRGGEKAARDRLRPFLQSAARRYHEQRDRLDLFVPPRSCSARRTLVRSSIMPRPGSGFSRLRTRPFAREPRHRARLASPRRSSHLQGRCSRPLR